ncbi:O-methylsterigmatocystin oxidoreductase [Coccidioides immitis H538.4]|uniref:O-methylsterigmatocystin oxidoreductase n=1 Tax=Coccidioides immitis H538.4 TaxID=396776 RepID=A0A0J8RLR9_COCIT|nr:O-methylsterigmatocystin oxidoreductase [Coccidioides immitis H538.4]
MLRLSVLLGLTAAAIAVARLLSIGRRPKNYPPGPPTLPLLGNIHQMPKRDAHLQFAKWAKEYGPVYSLILGTQCLIVLSSDEAVKALLDKKSGIYSHRQEMYIGQEVCSGGLRLLMMGYGPKWRGFRKMVHGLLNVTTSKSYVVYQTLENKQMLYEFLTEPDRFLYHIRRYSNALTTTMVFGWRTPTYEDAKMKQLFDGFSEFAEINQTGAAALIDFFPWLRNLPDFLLPLHKKAKDLHKHEKALYLGHWLKAKDDIRRGTIKPCFCVGMAEAQKSEGFDDDQAAYISGTLLEAGSDTTSSTLYAFVQAMLLYPEIQRRAQKEIDEVVRADRMPNMDDQDSLQYIRAIMKETLRWMPTTILGVVPHAVTQDDHYMGYLIGKGAGVMNNVWGIHHDEKHHPSLASSIQSATSTITRALANPPPTLTAPSVINSPSALVAVSALGRPIIPDPDRLTQGFVCMPEEFPAKITPRSKARADFVTREWKEAEKACLDPQSKQWLLHPLE